MEFLASIFRFIIENENLKRSVPKEGEVTDCRKHSEEDVLT